MLKYGMDGVVELLFLVSEMNGDKKNQMSGEREFCASVKVVRMNVIIKKG